ncbi:MAG: SDR family NAD(P)-dependent oxidoreductase [Opitutae bacterium]|nr:SDR family NAD(P)-dependent oxidoreductase [Opitutae bacterium]
MRTFSMLQTFSALVVTGGSSGLGKSFIEHVGKLHPNCRIFNLSRRPPERTVPDLILRHWPCDLADRAQTTRVCEELVATLNREVPTGRVLLINNSGFGTYGSFPEPNLARHLEMLDVNMRAPLHLTAALLPLFRVRGGAVINIASTAAFQPTAHMATYGATKAFLLHWSLALSEELRGSGIQVLAVCPGPTTTEFFRAAGLAGAAADAIGGQTPEEVVATSFRALAAGRTLVVSGWKNKVLVALASKLPKALAARLAARVIARFRRLPRTSQP